MPRQGHDPIQAPPPRLACSACQKTIRNKSGLTQHRNQCHVLLARRLRARGPGPTNDENEPNGPPSPDHQNLPDDENNPERNPDAGGGYGGDDFEGGNDDMQPPMDVDDDEGDGRAARVRRHYHEGLTGAFNPLLLPLCSPALNNFYSSAMR